MSMINIRVQQKEIKFEVQQPKPVQITIGRLPLSFTVANRNVTYNINTDNVIPKNIINAKGDIIVGNEVAEPSRLPIGQPNYFMVVDPSQDRGYKFTNEIDGGTF